MIDADLTSSAPPPASPVDELLSISRFSRRSLLSMKALRLYDRLGLLVPHTVDPDSRYRSYRASQLETARLIAMLRRLDMPLAQVAAVVGATPADRADVLTAWWAAAEDRFGRQRELMVWLRNRFTGDERQYDMFEVQERDVPDQFVLTEQRQITVAGLSDWMGAAIGRHWQTAEAYGGIAGPIFVIFHGKVDEDSDGPVKVCGPIDPAAGSTVEHATRVEPAHREAYTRLRKAQVEFPQILTAYDAVERWIAQSGQQRAGPPREVYFTDVMATGPDDEVTDIAFPIGEPPPGWQLT